MNAVFVASLGVVILALMMFVRWKLRPEARRLRWLFKLANCLLPLQNEGFSVTTLATQVNVGLEPVPSPTKLVHQLGEVKSFQLEAKDSLDEHLDLLTKKLAEKEGRLRISKSKLRETQYEIENFQPLDVDVRSKYKDVMESLKGDLVANERECKSLQDQIEWVSLKRAELHDEVVYGQKVYGQAAAELASNLAELQRGRTDYRLSDRMITEKPLQSSFSSLRHRKEPSLPHMTGPLLIKSPQLSPRLPTPTESVLRPPS